MIAVHINGAQMATDEIMAWQQQRVQVSKKLLERKTHRKFGDIDAKKLADIKYSIPQENMLRLLKDQMDFAAFGTHIAVPLARGKRKISVVDFDVDFCDAKTMRRLYDDMMLNNTPANLWCNLRANPDHYLLRGDSADVQEVVEITGGLPFVSHFFIHYGDFDGLQSREDPDYPYQAAGVSYLEDGLAIGAVRHQMKDTENGCHIKLAVEFPSTLPDRGIRAHQKHLACEFYNWFIDFEYRLKKSEQAAR